MPRGGNCGEGGVRVGGWEESERREGGGKRREPGPSPDALVRRGPVNGPCVPWSWHPFAGPCACPARRAGGPGKNTASPRRDGRRRRPRPDGRRAGPPAAARRSRPVGGVRGRSAASRARPGPSPGVDCSFVNLSLRARAAPAIPIPGPAPRPRLRGPYGLVAAGGIGGDRTRDLADSGAVCALGIR